MFNNQKHVSPGLLRADVCRALEQGMGEKELNDLSKWVRDAINLLTS